MDDDLIFIDIQKKHIQSQHAVFERFYQSVSYKKLEFRRLILGSISCSVEA